MSKLSEEERDLLTNVILELDRIFYVLSNSHGGTKSPENQRILTYLEERLKRSVQEVSRKDLDSI